MWVYRYPLSTEMRIKITNRTNMVSGTSIIFKCRYGDMYYKILPIVVPSRIGTLGWRWATHMHPWSCHMGAHQGRGKCGVGNWLMLGCKWQRRCGCDCRWNSLGWTSRWTTRQWGLGAWRRRCGHRGSKKGSKIRFFWRWLTRDFGYFIQNLTPLVTMMVEGRPK